MLRFINKPQVFFYLFLNVDFSINKTSNFFILLVELIKITTEFAFTSDITVFKIAVKTLTNALPPHQQRE